METMRRITAGVSDAGRMAERSRPLLGGFTADLESQPRPAEREAPAAPAAPAPRAGARRRRAPSGRFRLGAEDALARRFAYMRHAPRLKAEAGLRDHWGCIACAYLLWGLAGSVLDIAAAARGAEAPLDGGLAPLIAWVTAACLAGLASWTDRASPKADALLCLSALGVTVAALLAEETSASGSLGASSSSPRHALRGAAAVLAVLALAGVHAPALAAMWLCASGAAVFLEQAGHGMRSPQLDGVALGALFVGFAALHEWKVAAALIAKEHAEKGREVIMESATEGAGVISAESGEVLKASSGLQKVLGTGFVRGVRFEDFVHVEDRATLKTLWKGISAGQTRSAILAVSLPPAEAQVKEGDTAGSSRARAEAQPPAAGERLFQDSRLIAYEVSDDGGVTFCLQLLGEPWSDKVVGAAGGEAPAVVSPPAAMIVTGSMASAQSMQSMPSAPMTTQESLPPMSENGRQLDLAPAPGAPSADFGGRAGPSAGGITQGAFVSTGSRGSNESRHDYRSSNMSDISFSLSVGSSMLGDVRGHWQTNDANGANKEMSQVSELTAAKEFAHQEVQTELAPNTEQGVQTEQVEDPGLAEGVGGVCDGRSNDAFGGVPPTAALAAPPAFGGHDTVLGLLGGFKTTPPNTCTASLHWAMLHWNIPMKSSMCCPWHNALQVAMRLLSIRESSPCTWKWNPLSGWQCGRCGSMNHEVSECCDMCREHHVKSSPDISVAGTDATPRSMAPRILSL